MDHSHPDSAGQQNGMLSRAKWVLIAFIAIAAYFLIMEHQAHLSGLLAYLPYLLLLACPLLHVFMHGGHGDHGSGVDRGQAGTKGERP